MQLSNLTSAGKKILKWTSLFLPIIFSFFLLFNKWLHVDLIDNYLILSPYLEYVTSKSTTSFDLKRTTVQQRRVDVTLTS